MTEYIERDAALEKFARNSDARYVIQIIPAADVAPVVHARWRHVDVGVWKCTNCNQRRFTNTPRYCPWCGARMDLEEGK